MTASDASLSGATRRAAPSAERLDLAAQHGMLIVPGLGIDCGLPAVRISHIAKLEEWDGELPLELGAATQLPLDPSATPRRVLVVPVRSGRICLLATGKLAVRSIAPTALYPLPKPIFATAAARFAGVVLEQGTVPLFILNMAWLDAEARRGR